MFTSFPKAPVVAAFLAGAVIFLTRGAPLYGRDDLRLIPDKEITTMAVSQTQPAIPPIDAVAPAAYETATFALG
jgi:hypothetical protein